MKKIVQYEPCVQILAFLFVLVSFAESNTAIAFKESNTAEPVTLVQAQISGEWTAEFYNRLPEKHDDDYTQEVIKTDVLHLSLKRTSERGMNNSGSSFELSDFQGLTRDQVMGNSNVSFTLEREAGTFRFEGGFNAEKGSGRFNLTPSQKFLSAMSSRGYTLNEEKQFAAAMLNVSVKSIDDLRSAGFQNLSLDDVFKSTIFKVTPEFVIEMNSIGFKNLQIEDLVKARIFKVDVRFAREIKEMGFGENQPMETLVKMRIFKITPAFLREVHTTGLEDLDIEDLVKLRIFKIDSAFIQKSQGSSSKKLTVEELVRLKIHGKVE